MLLSLPPQTTYTAPSVQLSISRLSVCLGPPRSLFWFHSRVSRRRRYSPCFLTFCSSKFSARHSSNKSTERHKDAQKHRSAAVDAAEPFDVAHPGRAGPSVQPYQKASSSSGHATAQGNSRSRRDFSWPGSRSSVHLIASQHPGSPGSPSPRAAPSTRSQQPIPSAELLSLHLAAHHSQPKYYDSWRTPPLRFSSPRIATTPFNFLTSFPKASMVNPSVSRAKFQSTVKFPDGHPSCPVLSAIATLPAQASPQYNPPQRSARQFARSDSGRPSADCPQPRCKLRPAHTRTAAPPMPHNPAPKGRDTEAEG